jgi:hypothetical protein
MSDKLVKCEISWVFVHREIGCVSPCETVVEGKGGRWWDKVDKVVVVMGLCVCKYEAGGGAEAKSDETEP